MPVALLLALPCLALAVENAALPILSEPFARYEPMLAHSPFAPPSDSPRLNSSAGFAKDLFLTGVVRFNGGAYVLLASRDQAQRLALKTGETSHGLSIEGIAWSETAAKTKVTLRRGDEVDVIGFDETAAAPPANNPVAATSVPPPQANPSSRSAPSLPFRRRFFQ